MRSNDLRLPWLLLFLRSATKTVEHKVFQQFFCVLNFSQLQYICESMLLRLVRVLQCFLFQEYFKIGFRILARDHKPCQTNGDL